MQTLGGAVHNVDRNGAPVFIYAGQSPTTQHGEHLGSRNEFIHYLQDVPDQPSIVRQYMRYTAMIHSPLHAPAVVLRALTFARSEPSGPVYVSAMRETMEAHHDDAAMRRHIPNGLDKWSVVCPRAVDDDTVRFIVQALVAAANPVVITGSLGRKHDAVAKLVRLADALAVSVISAAPSSVCFPATHVSHAGYQYGACPTQGLIATADFILILDTDVPWIPMHDEPSDACTVVHIDRDPLKVRQSYFHVPVNRLVQADSSLALDQINVAIASISLSSATTSLVRNRRTSHARRHAKLQEHLDVAALGPPDGLTVPAIVAAVRARFPPETLYLNEAITHYANVWDHLRADQPGQVLTSGASSLGWGLGAAVGAHVGMQELGEVRPLVLFSGDGSFLFGVPSVAFWMARRYRTPFVTVVFNNGGWNAPKKSLLGLYRGEEQVQASLQSLHLGFDGEASDEGPDYGGVAAAAGGAARFVVTRYDALVVAIEEAREVLRKEGRCVVLDCRVPPS